MQRQSPQNSLSSLPSSSVTSSSSNSPLSANQPSAADSQKLNSSSSSTSRPSASQPSAASPQNSNSSSSSSSSPSAAAGNPPTATPTPNRKRKCPPKPGSQSYSQQIKDSAFATTKFESDWRKLIRSVFLSKTGMPNVNSFQTYSPVEDPIANAYEKCRGPGSEGMTQYLYFFGEGWKNSRWNRDVLARRVSEVVAQQENYRIPGPCLANDVILACLQDCLKQAQASWKRDKPRIHFSGERYETPEEAQARARTQEGVRSSSVRVYARKATKYKTRLDALDELLKDSTLTTFTRRKWEFARDIVHNLGKDGQSSEDTDRDDDELPLVTTVPYYRRRIVGELLQEVDREAARLQWKAATLKGKHAVVRAGKIHRRSTIQSHRSVARKLPEALYHRGYLQSLTPYEKELLQINKEISMPMFEVDMFRQESNSEMEQDPE
ncbi:hypothetical protein GGU11DRAFT_532749 [Lentinula aff. detonsa]|nr:hypothetical protein GGU11DRAFT_532749 [Lentinula aff. detonsa]